ncbi:MAG: hypothetical protein MJ159_04200 [Treponemataceae bacterium]|nr:hypothetical protein [Treponemataceae bacterium]
MKKIIAAIFFVVFSVSIYAENLDNKFEVYMLQSSVKDLTFIPKIKSDFGFVAAFYERLCLPFCLLDKAKQDDLRNCCYYINKSLKEGKRVSLVVKNYKDGKDLIFNFGQWPDTPSILVVSNYDIVEQRILDEGEDLSNAMGLAYYFIDGYIIRYANTEEAVFENDNLEYAKNMLYDGNIKNNKQIKTILENEIKNTPTPAAYIYLAQYYFNERQVKKGLSILNQNKSFIESTDDKDILDLYRCAYEEGKALELIYKN